MACARCLADPQPPHFGSSRRCAFTPEGLFTPDNWNCATLGHVSELAYAIAERWGRPEYQTIDGEDESLQLIWGQGHDHGQESGWVVLSRYKHRGCCSSAIHVGDFWPARPLTLALTEHLIRVYEPLAALYALKAP